MQEEFAFIAHYLRPLAQSAAALELKDDAALLTVPPGHELVITSDAMVAGVHFLPEAEPAAIASKLLAVNLSDLAAMGAKPYVYSLILAHSPAIGADFWPGFCAGLAQAQAQYAIELIGGDTVKTPGPFWAAITAHGLVPTGMALCRAGAKEGDLLVVSGTVGDAGLAWLLRKWGQPVPSALQQRLDRPVPQIDLGIKARGLAHAGADISDGLLADAGHIALASGLKVVINRKSVPLSQAAQEVLAALSLTSPPTTQHRLYEAIYTGGDDYELLLAVAPHALAPLLACQDSIAAKLSVIGHFAKGPAGQVILEDAPGVEMKFSQLGWQHF
jgi:thiamine-monophosphate kinase